MDKSLLKEVLSIPTYFAYEDRIRRFLISYGIRNGISVRIDPKGNVYLIKGKLGEDEYFPCVVAHMDTVHREQLPNILMNEPLTIHEDKDDVGTNLWATMKKNGEEVQTGVGGDDKAGIFTCLEIMKTQDKIIGAFFVEEEFGCHGSKEADVEILKDVGYFIQFDAPTDNWCTYTSMGVQLFNRRLFNKIKQLLILNRIDNISNDPYTDVYKLKEKFDVVCMNFFAGYHRWHTSNEFVIIEDVEKAVNLGTDIINKLGCNKQPMKYNKTPDYEFYREIMQWTKEWREGLLKASGDD